MGRRSFGLGHVDLLPGTGEEKDRLRVILETLSGSLSVTEACRRLSVSETRFAELRTAALEGALSALAPRPAGRPRKPAEEAPGEAEVLRRRVKDLELDLACACVKTEVALVMPHLLAREDGKKAGPKKGGPHPAGSRPGGASSPATSRGSGRSSPPSSPPSATASGSS